MNRRKRRSQRYGKPVLKVKCGSCFAEIILRYGFVHFEDKAARERALIPAMRIFGVQIRNLLCRTGKNEYDD